MIMSDDIINNMDIEDLEDLEDLPLHRESIMGSNGLTAHQEATHSCQNAPNQKGKLREAPPQLQAIEALKDLVENLHPQRKSGQGYLDAKIDPFVQTHMEGMCGMLNLYTNPLSTTYNHWNPSTYQASIVMSRGRYCICQLCRLTWQFILDHSVLPVNPLGEWNESMLADEDLANDLKLHLQELGNNISAQKIVEYFFFF